MTNKRLWIIFALFCIMCVACNKPLNASILPTPSPPLGPSQAWVDAPLHNSNLPLLPYNLVFHGASFVGITEFEVQINGVVLATIPPTSSGSGGAEFGTLFLGEHLWTPPAPGTYLIAVRAMGNGQYSPLAQVQVTVLVHSDQINAQINVSVSASDLMAFDAGELSQDTFIERVTYTDSTMRNG